MPVTVNAPSVPALLMVMAFEPPVCEMLLKVTPDDPIVALVIVIAVVVAALVAPIVLFAPVAFTVRPLPVAENTELELFNVMLPLIVTVPPVPASDTPVPPLLPIEPERVIVPPVIAEISTTF